jgi:ABC-type sugar transport system ATPase subunit
MSDKVLLVAEHIDKRFGITHAVNDVSLTINAGEIRALIGENGSGKSTFSQMLCGIYTIGGGTFTLDGKELHCRNQVEANNEGVAIIVQEMGTLSGLTVAENIFLGHEEPFMHMGVKDTRAMNKAAQRLLNEYGFERVKASDMIDLYNFEDRKLVEIVKATYMKPKILVVDETTTALSQNGRYELYKIMDAIRADALAHPDVEVVDAPSFYTLETFNTCAGEGCLMETFDAWEGVHPGIVTLPMEWNYAVPYGVVYAKEPALHVARFVGAIAQGAQAGSGAVR